MIYTNNTDSDTLSSFCFVSAVTASGVSSLCRTEDMAISSGDKFWVVQSGAKGEIGVLKTSANGALEFVETPPALPSGNKKGITVA